jgi:hypothetical protein
MSEEFKIMGFRELEKFYEENGYYADQDPRNAMNFFDTDTPERRAERINKELEERKVIDVKEDTGGLLDALPMSKEEGMKRRKEIKDEDINKAIEKGTMTRAAKGGSMSKQMELFEEGGLKDEGGTVDPVSGNEVPPGSTQEEVRDDIPAQLSEGEFVFPADVVRYLGLEFLMNLRQRAKAGLKKMEEMGQMGNSDEATLPDDIPFTVDDLEMAEGGVVEAQAGTYVAPSIPIFRQGTDQNMLQQNQMTQTDQMEQLKQGPGVRTVGMAQPFRATSEAYAPVSYQQFLGPSAGGAPETETQIYKHPDGRIRNIVIVKATGLPLIPGSIDKAKADGFEFQAQPLKDELKVEPVKQTSKVKPVSGDGGDDQGSTTSAVDPAGDPLSYSSLTNLDDLDKNLANIGRMQLGLLSPDIYSLGKNVATSAMGKGNINNISLGAITGYYTSTKNDMGRKGVNVNTLSPTERMELNNSINAAKATVVEVSLDDQGNALSQDDIISNINTLASVYGLDKTSKAQLSKELGRNFNLDVQLGKKLAEIIREREKNIKDRQDRGIETGTTPSTSMGLDSLGIGQQQGIQDAIESGKGSLDTSGIDTSGISSGISDDSFSDDQGQTSGEGVGESGPSGQGDPSGFGGTYKGSLITRKKPKPKKMKRGGLASKK